MKTLLILVFLLAGCGPGTTKDTRDTQILLCVFPCIYINRGGSLERVILPKPPQELPRSQHPQPPDDNLVHTLPEDHPG